LTEPQKIFNIYLILIQHLTPVMSYQDKWLNI